MSDPDAATVPPKPFTSGFNDASYEQGDIAIMDVALARVLMSFKKFSWNGELIIQFNEAGLLILCVDPAHVAMRMLTVPEGKYLTILQEVDVMMDVTDLKPLLVNRRKGLLTIGFKKVPSKVPGSTHKAERIVLRAGRHGFSYDKMDCMGMSRPKMPVLTKSNQYQVARMPFKEALTFVKTLASHVSLTGNGEGVLLDAQGDTKGYDCYLPSETLKVDNGGVRSLFSLDLLTWSLEALTYVKTFKMELGQDYPLVMTAERFGGLDTLLLAPRIENE